MKDFIRGRYRARIAKTEADIKSSQNLRSLAFGKDVVDDFYDAVSDHILIENASSGDLVASYRLMQLANGSYIENSYSAQFYDLSALANYPTPMLELSRFCTHPDFTDPDILRVAWAVMTRIVDEDGVEMLFGCSSFAGCDPNKYADAFALLHARHQPPTDWPIFQKSVEVVQLKGESKASPNAVRQMPSLLRTYLAMGGWVSDHAVLDHEMDTLHVFTAVEISAISEGRKRILRAIAE